MPPKRNRTVIDERQHPALAAPSANALLPTPASTGIQSTTSGLIIAGVVSVDPVPLTAPQEQEGRMLQLPARVLERLPEASRRMYQSVPSSLRQAEPSAALAAADDNGSPTPASREVRVIRGDAATITASAPREDGRVIGSPTADPASPTGSALEEDIMRQIAYRKREHLSTTVVATPHEPPVQRDMQGPRTSAADGASPTAETRPLILSSRWSRVRLGTMRTTAAAGDEASGVQGGTRAGGAEADNERGHGAFAVPAFANSGDDVIRFDSARALKTQRGEASGQGSLPLDRAADAASESEDDMSRGSISTSSSLSSSEADDAVYDADDLGEDGFAGALGLDPTVPVDERKQRMTEADPVVERSMQARHAAHVQRERAREEKLRRQFNRHMAGYDEASLRSQERALLESQSDHDKDEDDEEDEEDEEADEEDEEDVELAESISSDGSTAKAAVARARNESGGGFGAAARRAQEWARENQAGEGDEDRSQHQETSFPASAPLAHRQRFGSIFFETHVNHTSDARAFPCHHTLLCLRGPITIRGPCGLIGFGIGEASVGGFLLGKKQLLLCSKEERAVLMPVKKLKTKASEAMELPSMTAAREAVLAKSLAWASVPALDLQHAVSEAELFTSSLAAAAASAPEPRDPNAAAAPVDGYDQDPDAELQDVEAVFGTVDWDWVQRTIKGWRELFKDHLPTMLLVVQPFNTAGNRQRDGLLFHHPMRKHYLHSAQARRRMRRRTEQQQRGRKAGGATEEADDGSHWFEHAAEELLQLKESDASGQALPGDGAEKEGGEEEGAADATRGTHGLRRKRARGDTGGREGSAFVMIPSFISRWSAQNIDLALVPDIVPSTTRLVSSGATGGCVLVAGSADIGKSTLCRFLANAYLSQHGLCFWLDLDLGQPEFGVPGQFGLYCVRRPLLRPYDNGCAELIKSVFVGSTTASNPQAVSYALASLCQFVATHVSRRHPVVVNTHGWVLHTGRRVTVEAIQRLLPKAVIHLVKDREEAWASDTVQLLTQAHGLNADTVARRFLVRDDGGVAAPGQPALSPADDGRPASQDATKRRGAKGGSNNNNPSSPRAPPAAADENSHSLLGCLPRAATSAAAGGASWDGTVYTVRVSRDTGSLKQRVARRTEKGSAGRQQRWQSYLSSLLELYEGVGADGNSSATTTLLRAPLHSLRAVVLADKDERLRSRHATVPAPSPAELAATLEHRVVAVQIAFRPTTELTSSARPSAVPAVVALDGLTEAFEVTCFGYVESTEGQMLGTSVAAERGGGGHIALRVPLKPATVERLLSCEGAAISIATSPGMLQETHFMECYP